MIQQFPWIAVVLTSLTLCTFDLQVILDHQDQQDERVPQDPQDSENLVCLDPWDLLEILVPSVRYLKLLLHHDFPS